MASGNPMFKTIQSNNCTYLSQLQTVFPKYPVLPLYIKLNQMFYLIDIIEKLGLIYLSIFTDAEN